jgi:hypothetical protein
MVVRGVNIEFFVVGGWYKLSCGTSVADLHVTIVAQQHTSPLMNNLVSISFSDSAFGALASDGI